MMLVHTPGMNDFPELRSGVRKVQDKVTESRDMCTKDDAKRLKPIGFGPSPKFCNKAYEFLPAHPGS